MKIRAVVVLVSCLIFAAGHSAVSDGDHGGLIDERNAMLDFHDSLAKFASSLRKFEKRGQEVLNAAAGKGNGSALAAERDTAALEPRRRRRSRRRRGRGGGDGGVAAYRSDDRSFKTQAYVTDGTDDLVQKRDDESLRVIRIKILHHGRGEGDAARGPYSKTTPCPVELLASAAARRTTVVARGHKSTRRVPSTQKAKQKVKKTKANRSSTSKKTSSVSQLTSAPIKNCAQNDDVQVDQDNLEVQDSEHHEESSNEVESEQGVPQSGNDASAPQVDMQPPNVDDAHEYESAAGSEGETGTEGNDAQGATVKKTSQATKVSDAMPYSPPSRSDHLRIHIVHKPSNPQADVNETFFANHSLINKTGQDVLVVKTDDRFSVINGSKAVKVRELDRYLFPGQVSNYVEVRRNDDQEPYFANQDYVEEFERRVKQVNESLQRIRNYRQPPKTKRRVRRDNVRFMRSLRFAPPESADTASRKGEIKQSRVVAANSGSIRITINRRLDNEDGLQKAGSGRVAAIRKTEPDGVPRRQSIQVLDPQAREVPLRIVAKRGADDSSSADEPGGGDVVEMLVNISRENSEPLLNSPGKMAEPVLTDAEGSSLVSKYKQLRFRAVTLTCVLAVVSVFTVAVVLTMLYFDLNRLFNFKRDFKYTALDLTVSPYDDS